MMGYRYDDEGVVGGCGRSDIESGERACHTGSERVRARVAIGVAAYEVLVSQVKSSGIRM